MSRPKTVHPATVHPEPPLQKRHGMTSTAPLPQLAGLPGFPLSLTAFEEYLLRDGSPAAPLEFFFRIHLGSGCRERYWRRQLRRRPAGTPCCWPGFWMTTKARQSSAFGIRPLLIHSWWKWPTLPALSH